MLTVPAVASGPNVPDLRTSMTTVPSMAACQRASVAPSKGAVRARIATTSASAVAPAEATTSAG